MWHRRLGHCYYNSVNRMFRNNTLNGLQQVENKANNSKICLKNKISEEPYPANSSNPAKCILERVLSDICGPFRTQAICGSRYFATFIDECSRYCKVYPLKSRDEIASAFDEYKRFVKKQTGHLIKEVRTDNAAEYVGGEFAGIIKAAGNRHQTSVARCPQQNGISERMNRT